MAAAANLVEQAKESVELMTEDNRYPMMRSALREKYKEAAEALFAAQHSKSRREPPCPPCLLVDDADVRAHSEREEETPLYHADGPRANCPRCQQLDRIAHCWKAR